MTEKVQPQNDKSTPATTPPPTTTSAHNIFRAASRSLGLKFFFLGFLTFLLLIPLVFVYALVEDRQSNFQRASDGIGAQWGGKQTLAGPILAVPVLLKDSDDGAYNSQLLIMPDSLKIDGQVEGETRHRGIHKAIVYRSHLNGTAEFTPPDLSGLSQPVVHADWSRARLLFALSDLKGVDLVSIVANKQKLKSIDPGFGFAVPGRRGTSGLNALIDLTDKLANASHAEPFLQLSFEMKFKGSQSLFFVPVAGDNQIKLSSNWADPSFDGNFLPASRALSTEGFTAEWSIPKLARAIPSQTLLNRGGDDVFNEAAFGVRLYQAVDFYRLVERAVKYGIIFIGAAFLIAFCIEVLSKGRMHVAQYVLVGLMIIVFFTLLLALAERIGFGLAYGVASGATGAVLSAFVASLFPGRKWALFAFGGFAILYGVLYVILRLEDAALLAGSITGFVLLTVLMFATRKVDWSGRNLSTAEQS